MTSRRQLGTLAATTLATVLASRPAGAAAATSAPAPNPYPAERGAPGTLTRRAAFVKAQIAPRFPGIACSTYAATRGDHATGNALDCSAGPIGRTPTAAQRALMQSLADWSVRYAATLKIQYVIFEQRIWNIASPAKGWQPMEDRGSLTANHRDHVHISVQS